MSNVTLIIPNWNGQRLLEACLASVAAQTFSDYHVLLVDNGSTDGSTEYVREAFPWVRILSNPANLGFAPAVNRAIRESQSPFIATLNNDVWMEAACLQEMIEAFKAGERVGMIASKILTVRAPDRLDSAGISLDRAGFAWNLDRGDQEDSAETKPREVFGPCAAAALYRREMLDEIGLFDEDFFAFLEDSDLAWRARLAGWRCLYAPAARAYHVHSATAGQGSGLKAYLLARNRIWSILKNYPWPELLSALPIMAAYDFVSLIGNIASGRGGPSLAGRFDALRGIRGALRKRRQVQALRSSKSRWETHLCSLSSPWKRWRTERSLASATGVIGFKGASGAGF
ncbi:MAG: glycosyltransferase family 2 protein [Dehalococcoidia bacterium]|nr:glycosyltransferase family 2 protein [Dehalococcoidia bacterium]